MSQKFVLIFNANFLIILINNVHQQLCSQHSSTPTLRSSCKRGRKSLVCPLCRSFPTCECRIPRPSLGTTFWRYIQIDNEEWYKINNNYYLINCSYLWRGALDDEVDFWNVETSCSHICGNQTPVFSFSESLFCSKNGFHKFSKKKKRRHVLIIVTPNYNYEHII